MKSSENSADVVGGGCGDYKGGDTGFDSGGDSGNDNDVGIT